LTAAIEYVTLDTIPHIYVLAGNGEGELSGNIKELMDLAMMDYELLTLEGDAAVPEDAAIIIINAPSFDLSASATAALSDYLAAGGRLLVTTSPDNVTMPNLMSLMSQMGASPTNGMIHEGNANKYVGSPTTLKPTPNANHIIPYNVAYQNMSIVMPRCHGIVISETLPENVKATTLLSASDAYTVAADGSETDYGAVATGVELTNSKTGASIIWYSSVDAFSDSTAAAHGQAGTYYFAISASQLNPGYTSQILSSIEAVDVTTQPLNVSALTCMILGAVLALGIPAVIVVGGVIVWARRRKN
jgi:ABC-2 type transport system permease protein